MAVGKRGVRGQGIVGRKAVERIGKHLECLESTSVKKDQQGSSLTLQERWGKGLLRRVWRKKGSWEIFKRYAVGAAISGRYGPGYRLEHQQDPLSEAARGLRRGNKIIKSWTSREETAPLSRKMTRDVNQLFIVNGGVCICMAMGMVKKKKRVKFTSLLREGQGLRA